MVGQEGAGGVSERVDLGDAKHAFERGRILLPREKIAQPHENDVLGDAACLQRHPLQAEIRRQFALERPGKVSIPVWQSWQAKRDDLGGDAIERSLCVGSPHPLFVVADADQQVV
jgi:hypothetical protein